MLPLKKPRSALNVGAYLALGALFASLAAACGDGSEAPFIDGGDGPDTNVPSTDPCATPNEGCACEVDEEAIDCGKVQRRSGSTTWCTTGTRTCNDGKWGACVGDVVKEIHVNRSLTGAQALGSSTSCNNECDPFCQRVDDDSSELDLAQGLVEAPGGGITLEKSVPTVGGNPVPTCTGIQISPSLATLNVTSLPLVSSPANSTQFTVDVVPPGCVQGPLTATWNVDKRERAAITDQGVATLFSPVAGDITVTAYAGPFSAVATLRVNVNVADNSAAPGGALAAFNNAPVQNDVAKVLYPYQETVFPLGLVPPVIQWDTGGTAANNVSSGAAYTGVTATASSVEGGGTPASYAVDGNLTTRWSSAFSDPQWLKLDLGSVKSISRVRILWQNAYSTNYQLQTSSDNSNWTTLKSVVGSDGDYDDHVFNTVNARYVRIYGTARSGPYGHSLFEAWVYPGGASSDSAKVSLRYPADGSVFNWSGVFSESTPPRITLPATAWKYFEASAKGKDATIVVQRAINGTPRREIVRPIHFGTGPLRGKIYYTEYGGLAQLMVADPGSSTISTSVYDPATETGGYKCPVCHTVSANGNLLANSDQSWSTNGGLSRINANGSVNFMTPYVSTDSPYHDDSGSQFRGFGWGALTPDGTYALTASRMTGNAWDDPVGITPTTVTTAARSVSLPNNFMLGNGNGTGLLAKYFTNTARTGWEWRRFDPRVDFNWGSASPGGPVPTTFSAIWSGQLQPYTSEEYTFTVATNGGAKLTVNGNVIINSLGNTALTNLTGKATLIKGVKVPILLEYTDPNATAEMHLYWQSATVPYTLIPQTQLYPNDGAHGLVVSYFNNNTFTAPAAVTSRMEPDASADWTGSQPYGVAAGDFSSTWSGRIQAPATGNLKLCAQLEANDRAKIQVNGVVVYDGLGAAGSGTATTVCQATTTAVTQGTLYPLDLWHADYGGNAKLVLTWQMSGTTTFAAEPVPAARLLPASSWTAPAKGLTATYYDTIDFNQTIATGAAARAFTRIDSSADIDWSTNRPSWSVLTDNDSFSWTMTGQLEATCTGMHEFTIDGTDGNDRRRMWLDDVRIVNRWAAINNGDTGGGVGAAYLVAGQRYDIKVDGSENNNGASVVLKWKPPAAAGCTNAWAAIPNSAFYPTGDTDAAGFSTRDGGDNGTNSPYFIWKTPTAIGPNATDMSTGTGATPGRWGLGTASLMVPAFSPDSTKLVYVNGDSANGGGWRKGLSTFTFDQASKTFTNRRLVVDTWPFGNVIKWPAFESDSRSVIYQAGHPTELCCDTTRSSAYGHMGPSNYFEDTGRAFSVDTQAVTPVPVELTNLNKGESVPALRRPLDANKVYQPTMLPKTAAGYRWAVFTSTRPYGNTLNQTNQNDYTNVDSYSPMMQTNSIQSMLWVSAIDDTASAGTDRSHPAFFLPNQRFKRDEVNEQRYVNERGFWVKEPCRPIGTSAASSCEVDEDCCGATDSPATARCIIDTPVSNPVTRHCAAAPRPNVCSNTCVTDADCCSPTVCASGSCQLPPPLPPPAPSLFAAANFERVYESTCQAGQKVSWSFLDIKSSVPADGAELQFFAESSDNPSAFHKLDVAPASADVNGVVYLGSELAPGDPTNWSQLDVAKAFASEGEVMRKYLKITVRLVPNRKGDAAPVLFNWRQIYSCPASE